MKTRKNISMRQLILRGVLAAGILVMFCIPQMAATANAQNHFFMDQSHNAAAVLAEQRMRAQKVNTEQLKQNVQKTNAPDYRVISEPEQERYNNIQDARFLEKNK